MKVLRLLFIGTLILLATPRYIYAATIEVSIAAGGGFSPSSVSISTGDTVRWTNNDSGTRNVSSNPHPAHTDYAALNLGDVAPTGQLTLVFSSAGTYTYHDHTSSGFTGMVTVTTPPPAPAATTGYVPLSPVFEQVTVAEVGPTSAKILWTTQRSSYTRLAYGTSSGVLTQKTMVDPTLNYIHSAQLSDLSPETKYFVKALGGAGLNEELTSEELTFTTSALQTITAIPVSAVPVSSVGIPVSTVPVSTLIHTPKPTQIVLTPLPLAHLVGSTSPTIPRKTVQLFSASDILRPSARGQAVERLQAFLANDKKIYPEGIVSGFYGKLTQKAVERFQIKYKIVLNGTPETTGFGIVGPKTRAAINRVLEEEAQGQVLPACDTAVTHKACPR